MENRIEEWRDVKNFEGYYKVSNAGRVYSCARGVIIKTHPNNKGYFGISLHKGKFKKWCTVHRLVAEAFIPNADDFPEVNHKDEDKKNNSVTNLEWCTRAYNERYGTKRRRSAESCYRPVYKLSLSGDVVARYDGIVVAAKENGNINRFHITECCRGKQKTAYGWRWEYAR